jgi:RNA-directed DNA polymerase
VYKLQSRIVKALKKMKHHLVKRLQYIIANSFFARLLAVRKVTTNKGKKTPGVDGVKWTTPQQKMKAALTLIGKKYKSQPLRRVFIEKKGKKAKRPLGIPTMHDRAMQALYALTLEPIAETTGDRISVGFRKYRSAKDASQFAFNTLSRKNSAQWVLEGDIKGCFDNISHEWILGHVPMNKRILKQFLKAGFIYKKKLFPTKAGTPQGGIISPMIANMVLDGMEKVIQERFWKSPTGVIGVVYNKKKVNLLRYADDFIITANTRETAEEVKGIVSRFLTERGLELSKEKTEITHINKGFDFLGWNFRKYGGKLLVKPSRKSIKTISIRIRERIRKGIMMKQSELIHSLNPLIRGWCNYHNHVVSNEIFKIIDTVIIRSLQKWARRRHQRKSKHWIKDRYWRRIKGRDWIFATDDEWLLFASDTKIRRHNLVRLTANPYIKEDKDYLQTRKKTRCA